MSAAFSPDHDDDDGGIARWPAARDRDRDGFGTAASVGDRDRRRSYRQSGTDALYDSDNLSLPRSPAAMERACESATGRYAEKSSTWCVCLIFETLRSQSNPAHYTGLDALNKTDYVGRLAQT